MGVVHTTIEKRHWLKIVYNSLSDVVTDRTVFPLGLFYWSGRWTLGGWYQMCGDHRDFRIDRITTIDFCECTGVFPEGVSISAYIERKNTKVDRHN